MKRPIAASTAALLGILVMALLWFLARAYFVPGFMGFVGAWAFAQLLIMLLN